MLDVVYTPEQALLRSGKDVQSTVRVAPQLDVRQRARLYAPEEEKKYYAQLVGYQRMPDPELLTIWSVNLTIPVKEIVSRAGVRVYCAVCGEEIINEREVVRGESLLCRACAEPAYYAMAESELFAFTGAAARR